MNLFFFFLLFAAIPSALFAAETLKYDVPEGWSKRPEARERWLGQDPTEYLQNGAHSIGITHYGLKDSRFQTPEDFVRWIKEIYQGVDSESPLPVAGRAGTRITVHAEEEEHTDHHGATAPPRYVYEEFIVLPDGEGFWALIFSFHRTGDDIKKRNADLQEIRKDWSRFVKTCRF